MYVHAITLFVCVSRHACMLSFKHLLICSLTLHTRGAFSIVKKATNRKTGEILAAKIINMRRITPRGGY